MGDRLLFRVFREAAIPDCRRMTGNSEVETVVRDQPLLPEAALAGARNHGIESLRSLQKGHKGGLEGTYRVRIEAR